MKSLCLLTITTSDNLWTWRVWTPDKSAGLRNSLITTSKSIIVRARLTELPMPCLDTLSEVLRMKRPSEQRTSKSCTAYNLLLLMPASQASVPQPSCCHFTEFSSVKPTSYPSFNNSGVTFEAEWLLTVLIPASEIWDYNFQSCRTTTKKQKHSELQAFQKTEKTLRECSSIEGSHIS